MRWLCVEEWMLVLICNVCGGVGLDGVVVFEEGGNGS